jgi:hypothetical protein
MKKIFLFLIVSMPFFIHAQQQDEQATIENIIRIYDSLPKENGKIKWHETIELDSSFTIKKIGENATSALSRILDKSRDEVYKEEKNDGIISAIGTFKVTGGSQRKMFNYVDGSAEIDFNIEILFQKGSFSFNIFEVTIITEMEFLNQREGPRSEFSQASLEEAFKQCTKSKSRKVERRIFYETLRMLQDKIYLLKIVMKQGHDPIGTK